MNRFFRALSVLTVLLSLGLSMLPTATLAGASQDVYIRTYLADGTSVASACYQLVGYSNVGCDDNRDGAVSFKGIPYGRYTVRFEGGVDGIWVDDFTIVVNGSQSYYDTIGTRTTSAPTQGATENLRVVSRDPATGSVLVGACYRIGTYSNEGCDENFDGMVTFDAIPTGEQQVIQTRAPKGYAVANAFPVSVERLPGYQTITFSQRTSQPAGTSTVSLVFIDSTSGERIVDPRLCATVGTSNEGCDESMPDGQIDFLDIEVGTHNMLVTSAPGYRSGVEHQIIVPTDAGRNSTYVIYLDRT